MFCLFWRERVGAMLVFAPESSSKLGLRIAAILGIELSPLEERKFEDGELKARPLVSVRGRDVFVVQSLHGETGRSPHDKLCSLWFLISTLRENGAARVRAVVPYLAYARKDRQTKSRDPVTSRYVAQHFEAAGADCVITLDVHNIAAFQNAFRCESVHLDTRVLFATHFIERYSLERLAVVSPDPGGVKRAQLFRETLERLLNRPVGQAFVEKRRSAGIVSGDLLVGDVENATTVIVDDLIASGSTMARAAQAVINSGAKEAIALAAHGLFTGDAQTLLSSPAIRRIIVTDSTAPFRLPQDFIEKHLTVVSAAPLLAESIKRIHSSGSISELLEGLASPGRSV
jgi:ribose-phosphate pyrophosphokinase